MEDAVAAKTTSSSNIYISPPSSPGRPRFDSNATDCSSGRRRYLSEYRDTLPAPVKDLISLEDTPTSLRASRLSEVLRNFGSVLRTSQTTEQHFFRSEPVDRIDYFLSHNWVVSRWRKVMALTMYFHFDIASGCVILWSLVAAVGYILKAWPLREVDEIDQARGPLGEVCGLISGPLFFISLLFSHHFGRSLGYRGPRFFLDKTCIPQDNEILKKRSIEKLGAFLCESDKMVALMTNHYLSKLWTIYEVGAFVCLRPTENIIMLPVSHAVTLWIVLFAACLWGLGDIFVERILSIEVDGGIPMALIVLAASAVLGLAIAASSRWAKRMEHMKEKIRGFRLQESTCTDQGDREIVYRNIAALMDASQSTDFRSQEESLAAFEHMIRTELLVLCVRSVQAQQWHYRHFAMIGHLAFGGACIDVIGNLMQGCSLRLFLIGEVYYLSGALIYIPLVCLATLHCGRQLSCWTGYRMLLPCVALWLSFGIAALIESALIEMAKTADVFFVVKVAHSLIMICLTRLAFKINRQILQRIPQTSAVAEDELGDEGPKNQGPQAANCDVKVSIVDEGQAKEPDEIMTTISTSSWN